MSGGVDSSVAAALLLRDGYDVVGCFMRLGSPGETIEGLRPWSPAADSGACDTEKVRLGHKGCCSVSDAADARLVAAMLGVPFYVCNFREDFGRIIDYFVDEYTRGRTPNPCVRCNDWLKFGKLHDYARSIDADFIASGHYARIDRAGAEPRLRRAVDRSKDQSYVLFGVPREQLARTLLPIGAFHKSEVRDMARDSGLPVFDKPDSQEICFVPGDDYAGLVERRAPSAAQRGRITDTRGNPIGEHDGQHRFTIGQRRGVGVALGHPVYVVDKDVATNTVVVGSREDLLVESCVVGEANWLWDRSDDRAALNAGRWFPVLAQYRSSPRAVPARARLLESDAAPSPSGRNGRFEVRFEAPQSAVTPGQAIVLYDAADPDAVLGGGWITSIRRAH